MVRINEVSEMPQDEFIQRVRQTTVGPGRFPLYEHADISVVTFYTDDLSPAQFYVMNEILNDIDNITEQLEFVFRYDPFSLRTCLNMTMDDGEVIPFLPPIVEHTYDENGKEVFTIVDGLHRCFLAREYRDEISVCVVGNRHVDYPYYAYPNPNGWGDVKELWELPEGFVKRIYRYPNDKKRLYRDFNAQFPGVQKPRHG